MKEYMVDIIMPVYNHELYLQQAIEGVVKQQVDFAIRLIIGEDCSTDNSRNIIKEFAAQYPDIIYPVLYEKNRGATANAIHLLSLATAKYIAFCEGDDYWIDDHKLQKQVDFLEANPDFALCFTDAEVLNEKGSEGHYPFQRTDKDEFTIDDLMISGIAIIPTPTMIFRNVLPKEMPEFYRKTKYGDLALHMLVTDKGKAKRLDGKTAVYRQHSGGLTKSDEVKREAMVMLFELYEGANKYFEYRHDAAFRRQMAGITRTLFMFGSKGRTGPDKLRHVINTTKRYFKYADKVSYKELLYYYSVLFFPSLLKAAAKKKDAPANKN